MIGNNFYYDMNVAINTKLLFKYFDENYRANVKYRISYEETECLNRLIIQNIIKYLTLSQTYEI